MRYYIEFRYTNNSTEVQQKRYYSFKRRIDATERIIYDNNGKKIKRILKLNNYNIKT